MAFAGRYSDHIRADKLDSLSVSIFLDQLHDSHGGVGANIVYSLGMLGDAPILLGSVGHDARSYIQKLARLGANVSHVHESDLPTASFNVITDSDQNQVGGFYPGAMFDSDNLSLEPWKGTEAIIVVSPHDPRAMRRQVAECVRWGLRLCYDVGQQVSNLSGQDLAEGIAAAEILILNDYELAALSAKVGRSAEAIKSQVPVVVTTLGKRGSVIEGTTVSSPISVSIVPPTEVVDPTGAGDAYRAGFLYGLSRSWGLSECSQLGATCATYAIEQPGTQSHVFDLAAVTARHNANFGELLP
jgi:adenosine kinase